MPGQVTILIDADDLETLVENGHLSQVFVRALERAQSSVKAEAEARKAHPVRNFVRLCLAGARGMIPSARSVPISGLPAQGPVTLVLEPIALD